MQQGKPKPLNAKIKSPVQYNTFDSLIIPKSQAD